MVIFSDRNSRPATRPPNHTDVGRGEKSGIWYVSFGCLEGVWNVSGLCLVGVFRKGVWKVSYGCLQGIKEGVTTFWGFFDHKLFLYLKLLDQTFKKILDSNVF